MKFKVLLTLSLMIAAVGLAGAQTKAKKVVTNADLEKYRIQREKAEADYRENYAKMGMPSPEELAKQIESDRIKREALSSRLAAERLQEEQLQIARQQAENSRIQINTTNNAARNYYDAGAYPVYGGSGLILGNGYYGNRGYRNRYPFPPRGARQYRQNQGPATVVGGGMIYTVPRSSATPPTNFGGGRINRPF